MSPRVGPGAPTAWTTPAPVSTGARLEPPPVGRVDLERAVERHDELHEVERVAAGRPGALDEVHAAGADERRVLARDHARRPITPARAAQARSSGEPPPST
ncbi:hypothetical protein [Sorangium sp. So ce131]|uniref:hypothetical protein n=1 Tax=Sorangium sp. So ce131 TaxID=3133282 RepID=UPI003F5F4997